MKKTNGVNELGQKTVTITNEDGASTTFVAEIDPKFIKKDQPKVPQGSYTLMGEGDEETQEPEPPTMLH
jgi:hypothetical protein